MKRRPTVIRLAPDEAERRRLAAQRRRVDAYAGDCVASAVRGCDFAAEPVVLRALMAKTAVALEASQDGPAAASALGAASHRLSDVPACTTARDAAERVFARGGRRA